MKKGVTSNLETLTSAACRREKPESVGAPSSATERWCQSSRQDPSPGTCCPGPFPCPPSGQLVPLDCQVPQAQPSLPAQRTRGKVQMNWGQPGGRWLGHRATLAPVGSHLPVQVPWQPLPRVDTQVLGLWCRGVSPATPTPHPPEPLCHVHICVVVLLGNRQPQSLLWKAKS